MKFGRGGRRPQTHLRPFRIHGKSPRTGTLGQFKKGAPFKEPSGSTTKRPFNSPVRPTTRLCLKPQTCRPPEGRGLETGASCPSNRKESSRSGTFSKPNLTFLTVERLATWRLTHKIHLCVKYFWFCITGTKTTFVKRYTTRGGKGSVIKAPSGMSVGPGTWEARPKRLSGVVLQLRRLRFPDDPKPL